jgi:hypothetical protein
LITDLEQKEYEQFKRDEAWREDAFESSSGEEKGAGMGPCFWKREMEASSYK